MNPKTALACFVCFGILLASGWIGGMKAIQTRAAANPPLQLPDPPPGNGPWVVRAYYSDPQLVNELASRLEPWEVHTDQGYLVAEVYLADYLWMQSVGFRLEVDPTLTQKLTAPRLPLPGQVSGIPSYPCYRTVEETYATAESLAQAYPHLASWTDIGDSWEKATPGGASGYDLRVMRLTNDAIAGPKPGLFIMSSVHAREYAPAELNTRFAEYLLANYNVDADVTWLLDYNVVHLLFQANPDGRKKAEAGLLWRKNTDNQYCIDPNSTGVDLNRNFKFRWGCCGGSSANSCDEVYRGPTATSEPETQAIQDYVRAHFPDQRSDPLTSTVSANAAGIFLDLHSYSELVLWPWGFTDLPAPNSLALQTLGRKLAYFNGYTPEQANRLYITDGTSDDFAYGDLGLAAYTIEMGTSFFQDCDSFKGAILSGNLPALIYAAKAARLPYQIPSGPDSLSVTVSPSLILPGEPVTLTAAIDDTRYNNINGAEPSQNIIAAEYSLDAPPWISTTARHPLTPVDGSFDSSVENVSAQLDTTGLNPGRHILYVHGDDASGNWGAVSAAFLYVLDPATSPTIQGYVREAGTRFPLSATIEAGQFSVQSEPTTGFYRMHVISGTYGLSAITPGYLDAKVSSLTAPASRTILQNFVLTPTCTIFSDDVEGGNAGWTPQGNWAITNEASHSPTHSWTDSPGSNYQNNLNISLTSPVLDLSGYTGVNLRFWQRYDLETGYDYARLEFSTNAGQTWYPAQAFTGNSGTSWSLFSVLDPSLDGQANARIRFRLTTDPFLTADGWHIDDLSITGGDLSCAAPEATHAGFLTNNPVVLGQPVETTNLSYGTPPLSYTWDFGDGNGSSTLLEPSYIFSAAGTYTLTLAVSGSLGSDQTAQQVVVYVPQNVFLALVAKGGP